MLTVIRSNYQSLSTGTIKKVVGNSKVKSNSSQRQRQTKRMLLRNAVVPPRAAIFINIVFFFFFTVNIGAETSNDPQLGCSKTCLVENCNSIWIRYGKYCGVGWTGCAGEDPCDDLDACCQIHDQCVNLNGLTNITCHEELKRCILKVDKSGKVGFSDHCPYDRALPTLLRCMDVSISLSHFFLLFLLIIFTLLIYNFIYSI